MYTPASSKVCLGNGCGGPVGSEAVGTCPSVVGQGNGQGVVDELGHLEVHIVAEARGPHRLNGHGRAHARGHFQHGHFFHGTAVGIHERTRAFVGLVVAGNGSGPKDVGLGGQAAVALQQQAVVRELHLVSVRDAVLAQGVVVQHAALEPVCALAQANTNRLKVCLEFAGVVSQASVMSGMALGVTHSRLPSTKLVRMSKVVSA